MIPVQEPIITEVESIESIEQIERQVEQYKQQTDVMNKEVEKK